jgi:hypothetical protein
VQRIFDNKNKDGVGDIHSVVLVYLFDNGTETRIPFGSSVHNRNSCIVIDEFALYADSAAGEQEGRA